MTDISFKPETGEAWRWKLAEEIGELNERIGDLLHALGKAGRHGLHSVDPTIPENERETNKAWLIRAIEAVDVELTDFLEAMGEVKQDLQKIPDEPRAKGYYWITDPWNKDPFIWFWNGDVWYNRTGMCSPALAKKIRVMKGPLKCE